MIHLLIGTLLAAGGTLALNQYWERDNRRADGSHPGPGRCPPGVCSPWRRCCSASRSTLLGTGVPRGRWSAPLVAVVTAGDGRSSICFAYTPLQTSGTALCTLVGAVPGALSARGGMGGRAAADVTLGAWVLFGVLFFSGQLPHTLSIARLYRDGLRNAARRARAWPVIDPDGREHGAPDRGWRAWRCSP